MVRIALLITIALFATLAHAAERTPEEISKAYFESLRAADWKTVASYYTPDARKKFREMMTPLFEVGTGETQQKMIENLLGQKMSSEQISKLSDAQFLERMLGALMGKALAAGAQLKRLEVVGKVTERPGIVHVVTRTFMGMANLPDVEIEKMAVVSFEKAASGWGLSLAGELKGVASALRAQFLRAQKPPERKD